MGVNPPGQTGGDADLLGVAAAKRKKRAAEKAVDLGHAGDRARSRAAAEPEQHRLRLVVESVGQQHGVRVLRFEHGVPSRSRGRFWAPSAPHLDFHDVDVHPPLGELLGSVCCNIGGPGLELVVDDDGSQVPRGSVGDECRHCRQRQRVGAA